MYIAIKFTVKLECIKFKYLIYTFLKNIMKGPEYSQQDQ